MSYYGPNFIVACDHLENFRGRSRISSKIENSDFNSIKFSILKNIAGDITDASTTCGCDENVCNHITVSSFSRCCIFLPKTEPHFNTAYINIKAINGRCDIGKNRCSCVSTRCIDSHSWICRIQNYLCLRASLVAQRIFSFYNERIFSVLGETKGF